MLLIPMHRWSTTPSRPFNLQVNLMSPYNNLYRHLYLSSNYIRIIWHYPTHLLSFPFIHKFLTDSEDIDNCSFSIPIQHCFISRSLPHPTQTQPAKNTPLMLPVVRCCLAARYSPPGGASVLDNFQVLLHLLPTSLMSLSHLFVQS